MLYKQRLGAEIALRPPGCFCESKLIYVVSLATDADTGDKTVIWTTSPLRMPSSTIPEKVFPCFCGSGRRAKGHVSSATTLNTYSHGIDEMQQRAAVKIDLCITKVEIKPQGEKPKRGS